MTGPHVETGVTPRMLEHLRAAAAGETRAETAARLWVTEEAVKSMRRTIIARLGARSMIQAVAVAYERGLLPVGAENGARS